MEGVKYSNAKIWQIWKNKQTNKQTNTVSGMYNFNMKHIATLHISVSMDRKKNYLSVNSLNMN